jgi:hypothetical protein
MEYEYVLPAFTSLSVNVLMPNVFQHPPSPKINLLSVVPLAFFSVLNTELTAALSDLGFSQLITLCVAPHTTVG